MDINTWLTIITVFTAIIALVPREEVKLSLNTIYKYEKILTVILLLFVIPYLIYFENLSAIISWLRIFTIENGVAPSNIAFSIFYIVFIWFLLRLFVCKSKAVTNKKNIDYFIDILNRKSFDEFFKLFTKYNSTATISNELE